MSEFVLEDKNACVLLSGKTGSFSCDDCFEKTFGVYYRITDWASKLLILWQL